MSSVIVEADRSGGPFPVDILFDENDGATRIWMIRGSASVPRIGLHRHKGDEVWRVRRGRIRIAVGDQRLECGPGELVVVPPNVTHGIAVLDDDTETEVIGEIGMGEWITVLDSQGMSREVEVHVPGVPWHRPAPEGTPPTDPAEMLAMLESTHHLL